MGKQVERPRSETYEPPEIRVLGSVEALTLSNMTGNELDADFPDGTPVSDLTFS